MLDNQKKLDEVEKAHEKLIDAKNKLAEQKITSNFENLCKNVENETQLNEALNYLNVMSYDNKKQYENKINDLINLENAFSFIRSVNNIGVRLDTQEVKSDNKYGIAFTDQCKKQIEEAENIYKKLSKDPKDQKNVVTAYKKFKYAKQKFETFKREIDNFIESSGLTLEKFDSCQNKETMKEDIDKAIKQHNKMVGQQKSDADVHENFGRLLEAKSKIKKIIDPVQSFIDLVDSIGKVQETKVVDNGKQTTLKKILVTLECESEITKANEDFNELSDEQKKQKDVQQSKENLDNMTAKLKDLKQDENEDDMINIKKGIAKSK